MLYVFDVANGTMITFDAKFAFQNISKLKEEIEKKCNIRAAYQVLLMSGGGSLEPDIQVSSYSTGTDTNPVYLISKVVKENYPLSSSVSVAKHEDIKYDLQTKVSNSSKMQLNFRTLEERIQIANEFYKSGDHLRRLCEDLVKVQHFQHQGWAAAVAHLDELVQNCYTNGKILEKAFDSHLTDHQQYLNVLKNVDEDMKILQQIPMLAELRKSVKIPPTKITDEENCEELTLLKWISIEKLKQLRQQCSYGFKRFSNRSMTSLKHEIHMLTETVTKINLKEIKNVRERIYVREQLMKQIAKLMQNQAKIQENFLNDHKSISKLKDEENTADMCLLHHSWLLIMLRNHTQLRYIWRRCVKDKDKLTLSIQLRLRWLAKTENKIVENTAKIVTYTQNLNRLYRELEVLRQVHSAPEMYARAVAEVVRRRKFSQQFFSWTSDLVFEMQSLYIREIEKRREFQREFEGHFLNQLFSGLDDVPPCFATELPARFDDKLPNLTMDDLKYLKNKLAPLNLNLLSPSLDILSESFVPKSVLGEGEQSEKPKNMEDHALEPKTADLVLVGEIKNALSKSDGNIPEIIRLLDESLRIKISETSPELEVIDESELVESGTSLKNQNNKISSLQLSVQSEDKIAKEGDAIKSNKHKLNFQKEYKKKLWRFCKDMEVKITQMKICQENLVKLLNDMKTMFKPFLEEFENKFKEFNEIQ